MAETALFVSAALLFMLGTIQIGVIGFMTLNSDAAAYYDARAHVLTTTTGNPEANTNKLFPQIPAAAMSPAILPAPTPSIPVDYGYNDPSTSVQQSSATQRHGGESMLQPAAEQVTVTVPGFVHVLGQALGVTSVETEAVWQECGTHFDIANVNCSLANPPTNSQTNYFTQGENTPMYMVGFNYLQSCVIVPPYGVYTGPNPTETATSYNGTPITGLSLNGSDSSSANPGQWAGPCANSSSNSNNDQISFIAMGTAEFLDTANWGDVGPSGSGNTGAGISGAADTSGGTAQNVFEAVACHQRVYAQLASYLQTHPELYQTELYSQLWDTSNGTFSGIDENKQNYWVANLPYMEGNYASFFNSALNGSNIVYGTGVDTGNVAIPEPLATSTPDPTATGDPLPSFRYWEGFDDATHGPDGKTQANGSIDTYNQLVQQIYHWDLPVVPGDPPSDPTYNNPTTAEYGCT